MIRTLRRPAALDSSHYTPQAEILPVFPPSVVRSLRDRSLISRSRDSYTKVDTTYALHGYYRPLIRRNPRHRLLLIGWAAIYILVAIQLAWLLRPFIGSPAAEVTFLRENPWDNAYVVVWQLVWRAVGL